MKLEGIYTLTLKAESVALILDAIADRPYKQVAGLFSDICSQVQKKNVEEVTDESH